MNPLKWLLGPHRYEKLFGVDVDVECSACHRALRVHLKYAAARKVLTSEISSVRCRECADGFLYPVAILRAAERRRSEHDERQRGRREEEVAPTQIWYARARQPDDNPNHQWGPSPHRATLVERIRPSIAVLLVEEGDFAGQSRVAVFRNGVWDLSDKAGVCKTFTLTDAQRSRIDALVAE
jgi:hypothetical protein